MAGILAPRGLVPKKYLNGATYNAQTRSSVYLIQSGYATSIFTGDPVTIVGGYVNQYIVPGGPTPAATFPIQGVFQGCSYKSSVNGTPVFSPYWPGGTTVPAGIEITAYVVDDPMVVFSVQSDSASGLAFTAFNRNAFLAQSTAGVYPSGATNGNTAWGQSTYVVTGTPAAANPLADVKVVGLDQTTPNGWTTTGPTGMLYAYPQLLVTINNHAFKSGTNGTN